MFIVNVIYGAIIGIANIIPGLSGGTMAVILGVYDKLIGAVSRLRKNTKKNIKFLAGIGIGALVAIWLCSNLIEYLLKNQYMLTNFFFIGIIIGSFPLIYKKATEDTFKKRHLIPCFIAFAVMIATMLINPEGSQQSAMTTITFWLFIKLFFTSAISAICMIIPGISGSFVMLLFGVYTTTITAISDMNILILLPIGLGLVVGLLLGAKLIDFLLQKYPQATYFTILGFVLGSIPVMYEKIVATGNMKYDINLLWAVLILIFAIALTLSFENPKLRQHFRDLHKSKNKKA